MQRTAQGVALGSGNGAKHSITMEEASTADADRIALFAIDQHRGIKS
jgi:hypothetical protein